MLDADVGEYNLVSVSSVLPKGIVENEDVPPHLKRGGFYPCVMARNTGSGEVLGAGIASAFREDDEGGYVVEHVASTDCKDPEVLEVEIRKKLKDKLVEMGDARDIAVKDIESRICTVKAEEDEYGCAMSVLLYIQNK